MSGFQVDYARCYRRFSELLDYLKETMEGMFDEFVLADDGFTLLEEYDVFRLRQDWRRDLTLDARLFRDLADACLDKHFVSNNPQVQDEYFEAAIMLRGYALDGGGAEQMHLLLKQPMIMEIFIRKILHENLAIAGTVYRT